jgi:adenylate kinase family enzyme
VANVRELAVGDSLTIVTGPPGAGKTTVARLVVEGFARGVHVDADAFWRWIRTGRIPPWLPESRDQNTTVIDAIAVASARYAAGGFDVIVDGIVGPWFVEPFMRQAASGSLPLQYVILRPTLDVALARAVQRGDEALTDEAPIRKMYDAFCDLGPFERFVIDTSELSAAETARLVCTALADGRHLLQ